MIDYLQKKYWTTMDVTLCSFIFISIVFPHFLFLNLIPLAYGIIKNWKNPFIGIERAPQFVWIAFYAVLFIYFAFSSDKHDGGIELEHKISFVLFPVIMLTAKSKFDLRKLILTLCFSLLTVSFVGLFNAISCSTSGGVGCFYTVKISPIHHPSYLMAYISFCLMAIWYGFTKRWHGFNIYWILPFTLLMLVYHLYSQSLAGILFLMLLIAAIVAILVYKRFGKVVFLGAVLILVLGFFGLVKSVPQIEWQWNSGMKMLSLFAENPKEFVQTRDFPMTGNEERLTVWAASSVIISENPLGVGLGVSDDALKEKLIDFNQAEQAEKALNAHNQFFQFGLEMGWIGIVFFVGIALYLTVFAIRTRNWLLLVLIASLLFNSLFESMLQRQSGMVFYIFWASILSSLKPKKELK